MSPGVCVCVSHFCLTVRGWGRKWCEGECESGNSTCVRVSLCGEMGLQCAERHISSERCGGESLSFCLSSLTSVF